MAQRAVAGEPREPRTFSLCFVGMKGRDLMDSLEDPHQRYHIDVVNWESDLSMDFIDIFVVGIYHCLVSVRTINIFQHYEDKQWSRPKTRSESDALPSPCGVSVQPEAPQLAALKFGISRAAAAAWGESNSAGASEVRGPCHGARRNGSRGGWG